MANPGVVPSEMRLYASFAPEGRVFRQGEEWPGDAWSDRPGGAAIGTDAVTQAMKDLIAAQDRIDQMSLQLQSKDHDLAQLGKERDEAVAAFQGQKQALLDAEKARDEAEKIAAGLTKERDAARAAANKAAA
jgi:hypothetical protein